MRDTHLRGIRKHRTGDAVFTQILNGVGEVYELAGDGDGVGVCVSVWYYSGTVSG